MNFLKRIFNKSNNQQNDIETQKGKLEEDLLEDVLWNFANKKYADLETFSQALIAYNQKIKPDHDLDIERIFISSRKITVQYMFWGEDEDGDEDQIEENFTITTDNKKGFALNDFLFQVHNQVCENMVDEDATFFQGLMPHDDDSGVPFFFLNQGS